MSRARGFRTKKEDTITELSDLVEVTSSCTLVELAGPRRSDVVEITSSCSLVEIEPPKRVDPEATEPTRDSFPTRRRRPTLVLVPAPRSEPTPAPLAVVALRTMLPPPPLALPGPSSSALPPPPRKMSSLPPPPRTSSALPPVPSALPPLRSPSSLPPLPFPSSLLSPARRALSSPPPSRSASTLPALRGPTSRPVASSAVLEKVSRSAHSEPARRSEPRPQARVSGASRLAPKSSSSFQTPTARVEPRPPMTSPRPVVVSSPRQARTTAPSNLARSSQTTFRRLAIAPAELGMLKEAGLVFGFVLALAALGSVCALVLRAATLHEQAQPTSGVVVTVAGPGGTVVPLASVYVDGNLACEAAPCTLAKLTHGIHFVHVTAQGFATTATRAIEVENTEFRSVHFDLTRESAPPSVAQPAAPVPVETLGFEAAPLPSSAPERPARAEAASGPATLNINSIPISNVLVDGRPLGPTPQVGVRVSPGTHSILFVSSEYGRAQRQVTVAPGTSRTVSVRLGS